MFERFTEKAIKVVTFSQEEAINAKHAKVYPEHILLGIVREGSSIAARFLRSSGLKTENLREKINEILIIKQNEHASIDVLPFSSSVKKLFKDSSDRAQHHGINYINPEHLFICLLCNDNTAIIKLFKEFEIDIEKIKSSVIRVVEKKAKLSVHPESAQKSQYFAPKNYSSSSILEEKDSLELLNAAKSKLKDTNYEIIGTEQIFQAILENKDSYLYSILESEGITYDTFIEKLRSFDSRSDEYEPNKCMFTPKAFLAINFAYESAKELGSAVIKPEHILIGLLKGKDGIAYNILKQLNVDIGSLYTNIIKPIEKQKPITLTIIKLAREEARRLGNSIVGTEQILLGIIGDGTNLAAKVLKDLGITLKDARIEVEKEIGYSDDYSEKEMIFTPRAKKLLELAWSKAKKFNHTRIESEHLLLAIIKEKECMAMKILENLGVDSLEIKQGVLKAINEKEYNYSSYDKNSDDY